MIWQLKILSNYLNPRLRLVSVRDNVFSGSSHHVGNAINEIRHGASIYTWYYK